MPAVYSRHADRGTHLGPGASLASARQRAPRFPRALDKGLDEQPGVEQPVGLLDDQEWSRIREGYSDATPVYDRADAFTLDKSGTLRAELPRHESTKHVQ